MDTTRPKLTGTAATDLLQEIRDRWDYATDQWREIRAEGATDMRYVSGDPWDPKARKARQDADRPCLSLDELGQYVNQVINDVRQNARAIKVTPLGEGANDETAALRQSLIRQIEYRSNAQLAYTSGFENAVQRSYGFWRVKAQYVSDTSFDQELVIEPLVNPDDVTIDPDHVRPDGSDIRYAFVRTSMSHDEFRRRWPKAEIRTFERDHIEQAPQWVDADRVWPAEYWRLHTTKRELLLVQTAQGTEARFAGDETPGQAPALAILQSRTVDAVTVQMVITNGVEILEQHEWPGKTIPIVPCYGKVLYLDEGSGTKRRILSMVRLARDPYMLYCYYRSTEAEVVSMTPKTPFIGYKGQFRGVEHDWQSVSQKPKAYLEANPTVEGIPGILPLPQRQPYDPPIMALEAGAEAARRAIQAAMGSSPLPTAAQRQNEKSGVALRQIESSTQKGSYHFIDHYDMAIQRTGAILDELLPTYYDTARDVALREPDDSTTLARINDPQADQVLDTTTGRHDVTISTGPSYQSEREAASEFADALAGNPQVFPLIADLVVKLKNVGPVGDQIADRLRVMLPPQVREIADGAEPDPMALQAQLMDASQQLEALRQALAEAEQKLATEAVKGERDVQIATAKEGAEDARTQAELAMKERIEMAKIEADLQIAEAKLAHDLMVEQLKIEAADRRAAEAAEAARQMAEREPAGAEA